MHTINQPIGKLRQRPNLGARWWPEQTNFFMVRRPSMVCCGTNCTPEEVKSGQSARQMPDRSTSNSNGQQAQGKTFSEQRHSTNPLPLTQNGDRRNPEVHTPWLTSHITLLIDGQYSFSQDAGHVGPYDSAEAPPQSSYGPSSGQEADSRGQGT